MATVTAVPVTRRALAQRLKRVYLGRGQLLRAARGSVQRKALGEYYLVDAASGRVVSARLGLEALGRREGVIAPHEALAADGGP